MTDEKKSTTVKIQNENGEEIDLLPVKLDCPHGPLFPIPAAKLMLIRHHSDSKEYIDMNLCPLCLTVVSGVVRSVAGGRFQVIDMGGECPCDACKQERETAKAKADAAQAPAEPRP